MTTTTLPSATDLGARLALTARAQPDRRALICPAAGRFGRTRTLTYGALNDDARLAARGLLAHGIGPGTPVVLLVTPGPEFLVLAFALGLAGAVPIVVDPGLGLRRLKRCLGRARPEAFIGVPRAHAARLALGWGRGTITTNVVVGPRGAGAGLTYDGLLRDGARRGAAPLPELADDALAMVAFTSGSTGPPKGVEYRRDQVAGQLDTIREVFGWKPGDVDMPTMPVFAMHGAALGVTVVLPPMDFTRPAEADPAMLAALAAEYGVTSMFASPALLETLSRWAQRTGTRLPSLRRVVCAGAPVTPTLIRRCHEMLDDTCELSTPYGATEALPATIISSREILGETAARTDQGAGVCVGLPLPGADIRVIAIRDEPIPAWEEAQELGPDEVGEIVIRAPWASAAYRNDPENTAKAKIPTRDGGFFHRIGDTGYRDGRGRVWFCGRVSHRVVTDDGETLLTIPCEAVFNTHPTIRRTALTGPVIAARRRPTLCIELEEGAAAPGRAELLAIARAHDHTRTIEDFLVHPGFPVDVRHNAKIDRDALRAWAQEELAR